MTITPIINDTRVTLNVKENQPLPRGKYQRTLTLDMPKSDLHNRKIIVKGISCGLGGCYCDAKVVKVK